MKTLHKHYTAMAVFLCFGLMQLLSVDAAEVSSMDNLSVHMEKSDRTPEQMEEIRIQKLQALHDHLKITSSQEAIWKDFVGTESLSPTHKLHSEQQKKNDEFLVLNRLQQKLSIVNDEKAQLER